MQAQCCDSPTHQLTSVTHTHDSYDRYNGMRNYHGSATYSCRSCGATVTFDNIDTSRHMLPPEPKADFDNEADEIGKLRVKP